MKKKIAAENPGSVLCQYKGFPLRIKGKAPAREARRREIEVFPKPPPAENSNYVLEIHVIENIKKEKINTKGVE